MRATGCSKHAAAQRSAAASRALVRICASASHVPCLAVPCALLGSVRQDIFLGLPWEAVDAHFDAITGAAYSVSLFTDWGPGGISQAWLKRRVPPTSSPPTTSGFFGAPLASEQVNPVPGMDASCCTTQGEAGAWSDRLSHFRADEQPSGHGDELQSEYPQHFIALDCTLIALDCT